MENQKNKNLTSEPIKKLRSPKFSFGTEVSLEELESLCSGNSRRPRGCNSFDSTGDNDDVLF